MPTSKKDNPHAGHRQRMKAQALETGLERFNEHQMLELLLFYGIPQKDTNAISHQLIAQAGSFHGVFDLDFEDLKSVKYMTEDSAVLLKLMPMFEQVFCSKKAVNTFMQDADSFAGFFMAQYYGAEAEQMLMLCLDGSLNLIEIVKLGFGDVNLIEANRRMIAEHIIRTNASQIIVSINHPGGDSNRLPDEDKAVAIFQGICSGLNVTFVDFICVGDTEVQGLDTHLFRYLYDRTVDERDRFLRTMDKTIFG